MALGIPVRAPAFILSQAEAMRGSEQRRDATWLRGLHLPLAMSKYRGRKKAEVGKLRKRQPHWFRWETMGLWPGGCWGELCLHIFWRQSGQVFLMDWIWGMDKGEASRTPRGFWHVQPKDRAAIRWDGKDEGGVVWVRTTIHTCHVPLELQNHPTAALTKTENANNY